MFGERKTVVQNIQEFFVKPPDPKELVRKWQSDIRKEQRNLEKQIRDNSRLEKVAQKQIREAAKRNDMASAKTLAKELVHTRRMTTRLWTNKAHMMSMNSQLTEQLGMVKVAGTLKQSTQVMKVVNDLIKVPELNQTMQQMSKEMMKAGLIEETMGEMMDDVFDTDDIEEDADAEVDKVLTEIAGETLEQMAAAPRSKAAPARAVALTQEDEAADAEAEDLQARLNAIRS